MKQSEQKLRPPWQQRRREATVIAGVYEIESEDGRKWLIGANGVPYREVGGILKGWVADREGFAKSFKAENDLKLPGVIMSYDQTKMPSPDQMRFIIESVFDRFKHEVICFYGTHKETHELAFFVPRQEVQAARVKTKNDDVDSFEAQYEVWGDIHSHPWPGQPRRSGIDETDMAKAPGLHAIVSGDKKVTWYGSMRGFSQWLTDWDVKDEEPKPTTVLMPKGAGTVENLMEKPSYLVHSPSYGHGHFGRHRYTGETYIGSDECTGEEWWAKYEEEHGLADSGDWVNRDGVYMSRRQARKLDEWEAEEKAVKKNTEERTLADLSIGDWDDDTAMICEEAFEALVENVTGPVLGLESSAVVEIKSDNNDGEPCFIIMAQQEAFKFAAAAESKDAGCILSIRSLDNYRDMFLASAGGLWDCTTDGADELDLGSELDEEAIVDAEGHVVDPGDTEAIEIEVSDIEEEAEDDASISA